MSEKEIALQLLNSLPDYRLSYIMQELLMDEVIKKCSNAHNIVSEDE